MLTEQPTLRILSSPFLSQILLLSIYFHLLKEMNSHDCSLPNCFPIQILFPLPSLAIVTWNFIFLGCVEWNCDIIFVVWSCSRESYSMDLQHITYSMELQHISCIVELQHRIHNIIIHNLGTSHNTVICNKELQHKLQGRDVAIFIHPN
jgi:hypothetical protein